MVAKKKTTKRVAARKKVMRKTTRKKAVAKKKVAKKAARKKAVTKKKAVRKKVARKKITKKKVTKKTVRKKAAAKKKVSKKTTGRAPRKQIAPYQTRRGEDYMNATQSEHFRELLLQWKHTLMEEVERTVHHMQDEASNFPDPNDRATQEEEFALELRTRDRERKLIKKINEALLTLESGDYGYCEVCGIEIGVKRLQARPTATLCIDCKTLDEIKERQLG